MYEIYKYILHAYTEVWEALGERTKILRVLESKSSSLSVVSDSLQPHGLEPASLLCPWNSPGKNTGVGCHALLQGIFPTQGSNPGLPHCRWILYHLSHPVISR